MFVFLALCSCLYCGYNVFAQAEQLPSKLEAADAAIEHGFNAVLDAEKVGANVTGLLAQLRNATTILAQAENSNRTGDSNTTTIQADKAILIAQEVTVSAQDAKQNAMVSNQIAMWSTVAFTVIGASVFISTLFLLWRRLTRYYVEKRFQAKPEVNSQ